MPTKTRMREVMFVDRDMREISGRWFTGAYDETGIDVKLTRIGGDPVVAGSGSQGAADGRPAMPIKIYGVDFPAEPACERDRFRARRQGQARGQRDARTVIGGTRRREGCAHRRARCVCGGRVAARRQPSCTTRSTPSRYGRRPAWRASAASTFPKQFQQFEAIAYANGPDGKPDTKDDLEPGTGRCGLEHRRIHRDVRRRRQGFRRHAGRQRPVHAERGRPEPEAAQSRRQLRRCLGGGDAIEPAAEGRMPSRFGRARICW